ncbi:transferase hexapeptide domain-containing protein [Xylariales sp. PMI_506]|nr:transferase hexapeptide domain-containing protein [Xylariales sp. PMI_506]
MASSSKRQSILPKVAAGPKAPVNFSSSITIADTAILTGSHTINISSESVVHPRAKFESAGGRVTIGRRCIIHERTHIGALSSSIPTSPTSPTERSYGVEVGDYVTIEVGAVIEAGSTRISDGCLIGIGARIGKGAVLGKHCTITAKSVIHPGEEIPDYTVVFSNGTKRTDQRGVNDLKNKAQTRQIEVLRRLIPSNPDKFRSN